MTTQTRNGITIFRSRTDPLSNFYRCEFEHRDLHFHSAEQCYQYFRALSWGDKILARKIHTTRDPFKCFLLGQSSLCRFNRQFWRAKGALRCMQEAVRAKFSSNDTLRNYLTDTGDSVICHAGNKDRYWGVGLKYEDPNVFIRGRWKGRNEMGKVLTRVRQELLSSQSHGNVLDGNNKK